MRLSHIPSAIIRTTAVASNLSERPEAQEHFLKDITTHVYVCGHETKQLSPQ